MSYFSLVGVLLVCYVFLSRKLSPQAALGIIVPLTWVFPAWFFLPVAHGAPDSIVGSGLDVKVGVGTGCLLLYCFMPGRTFPV